MNKTFTQIKEKFINRLLKINISLITISIKIAKEIVSGCIEHAHLFIPFVCLPIYIIPNDALHLMPLVPILMTGLGFIQNSISNKLYSLKNLANKVSKSILPDTESKTRELATNFVTKLAVFLGLIKKDEAYIVTSAIDMPILNQINSHTCQLPPSTTLTTAALKAPTQQPLLPHVVGRNVSPYVRATAAQLGYTVLQPNKNFK